MLAARAYIPAPLSIYERVYKLEAGLHPHGQGAMHRAVPQLYAPCESPGGGMPVKLERYWSYRQVVTRRPELIRSRMSRKRWNA